MSRGFAEMREDGNASSVYVRSGWPRPGMVIDRTVSLGQVPAGYRAMDARASIKVIVTP